MNDVLISVLSLLEGMSLGVIFYLGLWFTIKYAINSEMAALWFTFSYVLRIGSVVAGFYFMSVGNLQRLVLCLVGFIIARIIITKYTKLMIKETSHEN